MLTFGSLFAGIGGFDLGFERAGFQCKWQVEIDTYATKILERHWPDVRRERDIRQCGRHNLDRVDCIIGGFPCQDISYAGKGAGLDGARSGLFFEAIRLVRELRPRAVVLENVAGLLTRGLDRVLGTLAEVGFDAEWHCIPAAAVGAPHIRDRVFVLAYAQGERHGLGREWDHVCNPKRGQNRQMQPELASSSERGQRADVADTNGVDSISRRESQVQRRRSKNTKQIRVGGCDVADTEVSGLEGREISGNAQPIISRLGESGRTITGNWVSEPAVGELVNGVSGGLVQFAGRVATGIPNRVHKLRCLGNAIVPQVAEVVARMAMDRLTGGE
jgi:DNA (cytosine-5)-methyltransferase 1